MADKFILRVEVLRVDGDGKVDSNPIFGCMTNYACSDLDPTVRLCTDLRLMANHDMHNGQDFIKSRVTPFVNVREKE